MIRLDTGILRAETDFQGDEVIPGKYKTRYFFKYCDVTTSIIEECQTSQSEPSIWEHGVANTRINL
ncbi:MAG: hypothetical protein JO297_04050 [Nitrososphaeraceae archaeon]|nr:hypothetical protein [Nitrososphaeraceae archaeon]